MSQDRIFYNGSGGEGIKKMSKKLGEGLNFTGSALGLFSTDGLTQGQTALREGIRNTSGALGPIGAVVSAITGVMDMAGSATGLNLSNIDKNTAKRADVKFSSVYNNMMNSIPGMSMVNGIFARKSIKSNKSADVDNLISAYSGAVNDINAANNLSEKRTFQTGKLNDFIKKSNEENEKLTKIAQENKVRKNNYVSDLYFSQNQNQYAGYTPQLLLPGAKNGMKFPELENARKLISRWSTILTKEQEEMQKLQLGGKIENKNIIPTGELHKNLHHLEESNPELKDQITKKGIPVIIQSEDGVTQTAEIEKEEWTLRKEFTEKLEDLYKSYQETHSDEIAIEAGKLICYELLKNTVDKGKVIKKIN